MKIKIPIWTFILAMVALVLATKSGWAILAAWALARFAQKLAEQNRCNHDPETI